MQTKSSLCNAQVCDARYRALARTLRASESPPTNNAPTHTGFPILIIFFIFGKINHSISFPLQMVELSKIIQLTTWHWHFQSRRRHSLSLTQTELNWKKQQVWSWWWVWRFYCGDNRNFHGSDDFHGDDKYDCFYDDDHFHGDADYANADNHDKNDEDFFGEPYLFLQVLIFLVLLLAFSALRQEVPYLWWSSGWYDDDLQSRSKSHKPSQTIMVHQWYWHDHGHRKPQGTLCPKWPGGKRGD